MIKMQPNSLLVFQPNLRRERGARSAVTTCLRIQPREGDADYGPGHGRHRGGGGESVGRKKRGLNGNGFVWRIGARPLTDMPEAVLAEHGDVGEVSISGAVAGE